MTDIAWIKQRPIAHRGYHDLNKSAGRTRCRPLRRRSSGTTRSNATCIFQPTACRSSSTTTTSKRLTGTEGYVWQRTAAELQALSIGGTGDHAPTLAETLALVAGRVPLVIELKGIPGHDAGLVAKVAAELRDYPGKAAIMSFDHWLVRDFAKDAPGIPAGLTAWGDSRTSSRRIFRCSATASRSCPTT